MLKLKNKKNNVTNMNSECFAKPTKPPSKNYVIFIGNPNGNDQNKLLITYNIEKNLQLEKQIVPDNKLSKLLKYGKQIKKPISPIYILETS